jgi:hypothetical protein
LLSLNGGGVGGCPLSRPEGPSGSAEPKPEEPSAAEALTPRRNCIKTWYVFIGSQSAPMRLTPGRLHYYFGVIDPCALYTLVGNYSRAKIEVKVRKKSPYIFLLLDRG